MTNLIERSKGVQLRGNTDPSDVFLLDEMREILMRLEEDDEENLRRIVSVLHPEWNKHAQPIGFDEARRVLMAIREPVDGA